MTAFEDFVNTELPLRTNIMGLPTTNNYPRFTGVGRAVEERTPAEVLSDIGAGDVTGPTTSVDNRLARYDGTTGKLLQQGAASLDDAGNVSGVGNMTLSGTVDGRDVAGDGSTLDAIDAANTSDISLAGTPDYITLFGQVITRGLIDLANDVTGNLLAANLPAKWRTRTKVFYIENPVVGDSYPLDKVAYNITFVKVGAKTDTGTCTFNIEQRAEATPDVAGTDILSSDLVGGATSVSTTSFASSGAVVADKHLSLSVTSVASTPTKVWIYLEYTID